MVSLEFGRVDEWFAEADHIREDVFFYEGNTHLPLEQHAAVARYRADGKLTMWSSTQTPHYVHRALAKVLGMPPARIRVIATPNGGGFGGKEEYPSMIAAHAALLAMKAGRPVKIIYERTEAIAATLMKQNGTEARIIGAHQKLFQRSPRKSELKIAIAFLAGKENDAAAWTQYAHALLAGNEFQFID